MRLAEQLMQEAWRIEAETLGIDPEFTGSMEVPFPTEKQRSTMVQRMEEAFWDQRSDITEETVEVLVQENYHLAAEAANTLMGVHRRTKERLGLPY